ncbi:MAG: hypothetical protein JWM76_2058 [Pseudonocardiales bacterium]|nr:hypothetical protein [Pseudonocardiales bacterium]
MSYTWLPAVIVACVATGIAYASYLRSGESLRIAERSSATARESLALAQTTFQVGGPLVESKSLLLPPAGAGFVANPDPLPPFVERLERPSWLVELTSQHEQARGISVDVFNRGRSSVDIYGIEVEVMVLKTANEMDLRPCKLNAYNRLDGDPWPPFRLNNAGHAHWSLQVDSIVAELLSEIDRDRDLLNDDIAIAVVLLLGDGSRSPATATDLVHFPLEHFAGHFTREMRQQVQPTVGDRVPRFKIVPVWRSLYEYYEDQPGSGK